MHFVADRVVKRLASCILEALHITTQVSQLGPQSLPASSTTSPRQILKMGCGALCAQECLTGRKVDLGAQYAEELKQVKLAAFYVFRVETLKPLSADQR